MIERLNLFKILTLQVIFESKIIAKINQNSLLKIEIIMNEH